MAGRRVRWVRSAGARHAPGRQPRTGRRRAQPRPAGDDAPVKGGDRCGRGDPGTRGGGRVCVSRPRKEAAQDAKGTRRPPRRVRVHRSAGGRARVRPPRPRTGPHAAPPRLHAGDLATYWTAPPPCPPPSRRPARAPRRRRRRHVLRRRATRRSESRPPAADAPPSPPPPPPPPPISIHHTPPSASTAPRCATPSRSTPPPSPPPPPSAPPVPIPRHATRAPPPTYTGGMKGYAPSRADEQGERRRRTAGGEDGRRAGRMEVLGGRTSARSRSRCARPPAATWGVLASTHGAVRPHPAPRPSTSATATAVRPTGHGGASAACGASRRVVGFLNCVCRRSRSRDVRARASTGAWTARADTRPDRPTTAGAKAGRGTDRATEARGGEGRAGRTHERRRVCMSAEWAGLGTDSDGAAPRGTGARPPRPPAHHAGCRTWRAHASTYMCRARPLGRRRAWRCRPACGQRWRRQPCRAAHTSTWEPPACAEADAGRSRASGPRAYTFSTVCVSSCTYSTRKQHWFRTRTYTHTHGAGSCTHIHHSFGRSATHAARRRRACPWRTTSRGRPS